MFDSIIVVTDRRILDKQIQNTIKQLEQTKGVVCPVDLNSKQLREYLEQGKSIIITTVQKFPVISQTIPELKSKSFGVVIDEVHSSQSGETSRHLKMSLSKKVLGEYSEGEGNQDLTEIDEQIMERIRSRGKQSHISYFGFSGTPKGKTLELFGTKDQDGEFYPFHTYSMEQSIYEGFTLDVLQNYTTYKRFFKLNKVIEDDKELPKSRGMKMLVNWVDLHPHTIKEKTSIMLEHFINKTSKRLEGRSRGMLVTRSRLHCVKYKLEFDKQMKELGLPYKCLVGFSGKVYDEDSNTEYTESQLNGFSEKQTSDKLKEPNYRILIVNNKYQTGFDEPLLHTMYVDKKMSGLQCVQTLSRLNRTTRSKIDTFVLDFVNEPSDIQEAFQQYFKNTVLISETDPNKLYSIEQKIDSHNLFSKEDVARFIEVFYNNDIPNEKIQPLFDSVVESWKEQDEINREDFRSAIQSYIRLYGYISQIFTFTDLNLEKLFIYLTFLNKKLPKKEQDRIVDLVSSIDLEYLRLEKNFEEEKISLVSKESEFEGIGTGIGNVKEEDKDFLSNIITHLNEQYGNTFSDDYKVKVNFKWMWNRYIADEKYRSIHQGDNTDTNKKASSDTLFDEIVLELFDKDKDTEFYNKVNKADINKFLKKRFFERSKKEFQLTS